MKKLMTSILIILLLWLTYIAASWGIADLFVNLARYNMQSWEKQGNINNWNKTHSLLKRALSLTPNNPTYLEDMAQAYYLLVRLGGITQREKKQILENALETLKQSAKIRPTGIYTWANIALIKSLLQQYDELFLVAIENASLFGPWEPFAQRVITSIGLKAWYRLPVSEQQKVRLIILATIERGMSIQAEKITSLIKHYRKEYVICFLRGHKPALTNFCMTFLKKKK